jgi:hypothetical protein
MFRTPNVTMDNQAGTSVIVRILPEPQDLLEGDVATAPAHRVTACSSTTGEKGRHGFSRRQRRKGQSAWPIYTKREPVHGPLAGH